ncbi:MAG: AAA family ATPase [Desulfovermiculus sp.]|nr:AAA family ATPase [Desulfovermiculus sp.]
MRIRFGAILDSHERRLPDITVHDDDLRERFLKIIFSLWKQYDRKVVVLVDEYDKPILDNIEGKDTAIAIREELKNYYSVIKDSDPYIEFVFITGVSKFSKVSLFSGSEYTWKI